MTFQKIEGYFDASGKEENQNDEILVVSGLLSEAAQWRDFSEAWLDVLIEEIVPIGETIPVFHTTDFQAKRQGYEDTLVWTEEKSNRLYDKLIILINSYALYPVGIGVSLSGYRKLLDENPALILAFRKVGSFAACLAFWHCYQWAERKNYCNTITYLFDRGDKFRTEITKTHETMCKDKEMRVLWRLGVGEIDFKNKEEYIPIQAADVVAWEIAKDIKVWLKATVGTEHKPRPEFEKLFSPEADFKFYEYDDLKWFWEKQFVPIIWEELKRLNEKHQWFDSDYLSQVEGEL